MRPLVSRDDLCLWFYVFDLICLYILVHIPVLFIIVHSMILFVCKNLMFIILFLSLPSLYSILTTREMHSCYIAVYAEYLSLLYCMQIKHVNDFFEQRSLLQNRGDILRWQLLFKGGLGQGEGYLYDRKRYMVDVIQYLSTFVRV